MAYTRTLWKEYGMTTQQKVDAFNNMETQYDAMVADLTSHGHTSRYYTRSEMDAKFYHSGNDGSGSGLVAETLDGFTAEQILAGAIPSGVIGIWKGDVYSVPSGWVVCNGQNGTPDLRDRFVIGAGGSYSPGVTGGTKNVTPTCTFTTNATTLTDAQLPSHAHTYYDRTPADTSALDCGGHGLKLATINRSTSYTGVSSGLYTGARQPHSHANSYLTITQLDIRPPWTALLFIMKL